MTSFAFVFTAAMPLYENHSLRYLNSFGFEVNSRYFFAFSNVQDLQQYLEQERIQTLPKLILGTGSNILFTKDFEGCVLQPAMQEIEIVEESATEVKLCVGAGVDWDNLVEYCVTNNWSGLENLSLIPGTVGAAPVQNIGAYGVEVKDCIVWVQYFDLLDYSLKTVDNVDCQFDYRTSIFKTKLKGRALITQVCFVLQKEANCKIAYGAVEQELERLGGVSLLNVRQAIINIRKSKLPDPSELGNAGSFFKNPVVAQSLADELLQSQSAMPHYPASTGVKIPAAWLIEQAGFKGARRGNVGVHVQQALVLVNYGGGTGAEVLALAQEICDGVYAKFGITLEMEVNIV
ncbi:MAG: UDP-N-acetylmuramate dehydrogenase [Bacteroidales bacterium]